MDQRGDKEVVQTGDQVTKKLFQVHVLERQDKQKPGREAFLGVYQDTPIQRKGVTVHVGDLQPGDVIRWKGEPLKVVWVKPWPDENGGDK